MDFSKCFFKEKCKVHYVRTDRQRQEQTRTFCISKKATIWILKTPIYILKGRQQPEGPLHTCMVGAELSEHRLYPGWWHKSGTQFSDPVWYPLHLYFGYKKYCQCCFFTFILLNWVDSLRDRWCLPLFFFFLRNTRVQTALYWTSFKGRCQIRRKVMFSLPGDLYDHIESFKLNSLAIVGRIYLF